MIYIMRLTLMLLVFELAICGYFVTNKLLRVTPITPEFYLDDPFLRRTFEELSEQARNGDDADWQHLAEALLGQGYYPYAEQNYRQALKLNPENLEARFGLAFCLDKMGRLEESTGQYRMYLKGETSQPERQKLVFYAKYAIGRNYLREENVAEAEKEFQKNFKFIPAQYQLAKILIRTGRTEQALPIIENQLENLPKSLAFHYLNYLALSQLGRQEEALAERKKLDESVYLVSLNFNNNYIDPFYMKYGQERNFGE